MPAQVRNEAAEPGNVLGYPVDPFNTSYCRPSALRSQSSLLSIEYDESFCLLHWALQSLSVRYRIRTNRTSRCLKPSRVTQSWVGNQKLPALPRLYKVFTFRYAGHTGLREGSTLSRCLRSTAERSSRYCTSETSTRARSLPQSPHFSPRTVSSSALRKVQSLL